MWQGPQRTALLASTVQFLAPWGLSRSGNKQPAWGKPWLMTAIIMHPLKWASFSSHWILWRKAPLAFPWPFVSLLHAALAARRLCPSQKFLSQKAEGGRASVMKSCWNVLFNEKMKCSPLRYDYSFFFGLKFSKKWGNKKRNMCSFVVTRVCEMRSSWESY